MVDPILHSVAKPPKAMEVNTTDSTIDTRVTELLQSIYSVSKTAVTSIGLGKTVNMAKDLQSFVDPDEALEFGLEAGYEAVNKVLSDTEELARLLDIELKRPVSYKLEPVFSEK